MSLVAVKNPYAWIQREVPADEIRNPTASNRMVNYPYTKLMTSNISVDQSAALIICSAEAAARYGVPAEKCVFLRASTEMSKTILLSERDVLHRHPGQVLAAQRVLECANKTPEDLDHIDLYSCFPFAVQTGAAALGIGTDPVPSLTGGMTFFGGPFGNYVLHSKASMIERLRANPGSTGAIGSVGGLFAHFSYGLYSTDPGEADAPIVEDVSDEVAALPRRGYIEGHSGPVTIEAYTVIVAHEGPYQVSFAALTEDGKRVWGRSHDPDLMKSLLNDEEVCGHAAHIDAGLIELR
jgi:acetyl-CoA C-acetyltransferase